MRFLWYVVGFFSHTRYWESMYQYNPSIGILIDQPYERIYLPEDDPRVQRLNPYLHRVGVAKHRWTTCSRVYHDRKENINKVCGHLWNPTVKYSFQTDQWVQANFVNLALTKIYRQKDEEWINILSKIKKGSYWEQDVTQKLSSLQRELPELPSGIKPTLLHSHREHVAEINNLEFKQLPGVTEIDKDAKDYWYRVYDKDPSNNTHPDKPSDNTGSEGPEDHILTQCKLPSLGGAVYRSSIGAI